MTDTLLSLRQRLAAPKDAAALAVFRILFGLLVTTAAIRFVAEGWVDHFFLRPTFFFKYWGFGWVRVWPAWGLYLHYALVAALGLMVAAGLFYRVSTVLLFLSFGYLELMDVTGYLNHYYLLTLLSALAMVMPLHRLWSIDAWRKPSIRSATLPAWCTYLLRFQVAVVYLFAGLAKLNPDWLLHGQPLAIWLSSRTHLPLVGPLLGMPAVALAMSWGGFLYDTTIWLWLSWRRSRPLAYVVVLGFHTAVGVLFNIGMFPFIMTTAALVFFDPGWPRALMRCFGRRFAGVVGAPEASAARAPVGRLGLAALTLYAVVQLAVPLRHFAYPGDVLWNEQGMRWSWKVMVREKNGAVSYRVRLPDGRVHLVEPRRYLTDFQEREMSGQPDLILQLAHHIARDYQARGFGQVEVRADTRVSLNGRRGRRLIDPSVDLARIEDGIAAAPWILPEPGGPPAALRPLARRER